MKYLWDASNHSDLAVLHVDCYLFGRHDEDEAPLDERIREIRGVAQVTIDAYSVLLAKGRLFGWDAIKPAVVKVVSRSADPGGVCEIAM